MKNQFLLIIILSFFLSSCQEKPKPPERKQNAAPISESMESKTLLPSEAGGVDFWVDNNCTRQKPKATVDPSKQPPGYFFSVNKQQGFAKEVMDLDGKYRFDITSKGCNSIWITYSCFMPSTDLDINNSKAVTQKVLELIEKSTTFSNPPIDIKSKLEPLRQAVSQIGPFNIGEEMILNDGEVKETFAIERLDTNGEKVLLAYYFTKGPV